MDSTPVVASSTESTTTTATSQHHAGPVVTTPSLAPNQVNVNIVSNENSATTHSAILTPEQEEEIKLRVKYPNPSKPGGSAFIQKILNKGHKKYFDSGDYNMAKSKIKATGKNQTTVPQVTPSSAQHNNEVTMNSTPTFSTTNQSQTPHINNAAATPLISINEFQQSPTIESTAKLSNSSTPSIHMTNQSIINLTPSSTNCNSSMNLNQTSPLSSNINIVNNNNNNSNMSNPLVSPMLSSSLSSSALSSNVQNSLNQQQQQQQGGSGGGMSTSISTQSIHMLSASLSTEKLAQIQINTSASLLDSEEIGHGIPTPECLPQSRKHSIVQSKLATPRLSSS